MDILNQFGVQPILLAAQVVNFFILLFILKKFMFKPVLKILEERKQRIESSLKNAEEIEKRLSEITQKEEAAILKVSKESQKIVTEAGNEYKQIIEEGKKEYERILSKATDDAKKLIQFEKTQLEKQVKENLSDIVSLALEKVIGKVLTDKQKKEVIEKEVKNLS